MPLTKHLLQTQVEDEQRERDEVREQMSVVERRMQALQNEKAELAGALEQVAKTQISESDEPEPERTSLTLALDLVYSFSSNFLLL